MKSPHLPVILLFLASLGICPFLLAQPAPKVSETEAQEVMKILEGRWEGTFVIHNLDRNVVQTSDLTIRFEVDPDLAIPHAAGTAIFENADGSRNVVKTRIVYIDGRLYSRTTQNAQEREFLGILSEDLRSIHWILEGDPDPTRLSVRESFRETENGLRWETKAYESITSEDPEQPSQLIYMTSDLKKTRGPGAAEN